MEQFYQQPGSLFRTVAAIRGFAFADLFTSAAYLYLLVIWQDKGTTFALITLFQILHVFSWVAGLASASGMYAHEYILMTGMVYIVALLADIGSLIWRSLILNTSDSFQIGALVFNCLYVLIDFIQMFLLGSMLTQAKEFKDSISVALAGTVQTELLINQYTKTDYRLYSARTYVRIVSMIDLFLAIALAVMAALGLSVDQTFQRLILFQIPHGYLWIAGLGIEKQMLDWGFVAFFCIHYGIAFCLDFASLIWRAMIVGSCVNCSFFAVFSWIMVGVVGAMTLVSFVQVFLGITVIRMLVIEFRRLLPLVVDKLYPSSPRFYNPR